MNDYGYYDPETTPVSPLLLNTGYIETFDAILVKNNTLISRLDIINTPIINANEIELPDIKISNDQIQVLSNNESLVTKDYVDNNFLLPMGSHSSIQSVKNNKLHPHETFNYHNGALSSDVLHARVTTNNLIINGRNIIPSTSLKEITLDTTSLPISIVSGLTGELQYNKNNQFNSISSIRYDHVDNVLHTNLVVSDNLIVDDISTKQLNLIDISNCTLVGISLNDTTIKLPECIGEESQILCIKPDKSTFWKDNGINKSHQVENGVVYLSNYNLISTDALTWEPNLKVLSAGGVYQAPMLQLTCVKDLRERGVGGDFKGKDSNDTYLVLLTSDNIIIRDLKNNNEIVVDLRKIICNKIKLVGDYIFVSSNNSIFSLLKYDLTGNLIQYWSLEGCSDFYIGEEFITIGKYLVVDSKKIAEINGIKMIYNKNLVVILSIGKIYFYFRNPSNNNNNSERVLSVYNSGYLLDPVDISVIGSKVNVLTTSRLLEFYLGSYINTTSVDYTSSDTTRVPSITSLSISANKIYCNTDITSLVNKIIKRVTLNLSQDPLQGPSQGTFEIIDSDVLKTDIIFFEVVSDIHALVVSNIKSIQDNKFVVEIRCTSDVMKCECEYLIFHLGS